MLDIFLYFSLKLFSKILIPLLSFVEYKFELEERYKQKNLFFRGGGDLLVLCTLLKVYYHEMMLVTCRVPLEWVIFKLNHKF